MYTPDDIFNLEPVGKVVATATAIVTLAERGVIQGATT